MASNPFIVSETESRALVADLFKQLPESESRFGVFLVRPLEEESLLALSVTAQVFGEAFGESPELLHEQYASYLASMIHIVVCDQENRIPVGALSVITGPPSHLKTLVDLENEPWNVDLSESMSSLALSHESRSCTDIATLAVRNDYRKSGTSLALTHGLYVSARALGTTTWVTILDAKVMKPLQFVTGNIFAPIGSTKAGPYLGSESSSPLFAKVPTAEEILSGSVTPHEATTHGGVLEANFRFCDELSQMRFDHAVSRAGRLVPTAQVVDLTNASTEAATAI